MKLMSPLFLESCEANERAAARRRLRRTVRLSWLLLVVFSATAAWAIHSMFDR